MPDYIRYDCPFDRNEKGQYYPATLEELKRIVEYESVCLGNIDTSRITDMSYLFEDTDRDDFSGIETWNVSNVRDMTGMFVNASFLSSEDLSGWDVSNVENMSSMFLRAESFNGDISQWDVSGVKDMSEMFDEAESFNGDISQWNVSNVTNMDWMFNSATSFNGDLSRWNVSNVTTMADMFRDASSFSGDLSRWDVSNVQSMSGMFLGASSFTGDPRKWENVGEKPLAQALESMERHLLREPCGGYTTFSFGGRTIDLINEDDVPFKWMEAALNGLKNDKEFVVSGDDGGGDAMIACTVYQDYCHVEYSRYSKEQRTYKYDVPVSMRQFCQWMLEDIKKYFDGWIDWFMPSKALREMGKAQWWDQLKRDREIKLRDLCTQMKQYLAMGETLTESIGMDGNSMGIWSPTEIDRNERGQYYPATRAELKELVANENIYLGDIDVSRITDMSSLFYKDKEKYRKDFSGIEGWDVSHVTNMSGMFCLVYDGMSGLDISRWDVSNVRDMSYMFQAAHDFNGDISRWDVSRVTNMEGMFYEACAFNKDISGWNVSRVWNMSYMFFGAEAFDCDLSRWDVSHVYYMQDMFYEASSFTGDPRAWKNVKKKALTEALESLAWRDKA